MRVEFRHGRLSNFNLIPYIVYHWHGLKRGEDYKRSIQCGWLIWNFGIGFKQHES